MTTTLQPVDQTNAMYLSGRFAPIDDEISTSDLTVAGDVPSDLSGAFLRNGPNPKFAPIGSYTYPLEGDAMIHGVWFDGGAVRYANRYVETAGLRAEERAGRALFGGLMTPVPPDRALLGDDIDPCYPFKLNPSINVVRHADRILTLAEGPLPYEITPDLSTVGRYDFDGGLVGSSAHPKVDPVTGEMILFRYAAVEPYLTWTVIGADGAVTRPPTPVPGLDRGFMIHDFAITARYVVFVVGPLTFDRDAMLRHQPPLAWAPELGTRIALVPRDGSTVRWVDTDAVWAWHYANAYDDGDQVVVDFPSYSAPGLVVAPDGRPVRYLTVAARSTNPAVTPGEHDTLVRHDMATGTSIEQQLDVAIGEVVFAPRDGATDELDGYYLSFGTGLDDGSSRLYVWDAADFPAAPRAAITIPHRVPNGLHGSWLPASHPQP
jgi:carotenoid cleavage dioxygenase-like enzyme